MNADFQAAMIDAGRRLQSVTGEPVTINGACYTCTAATEVKGSIEFFQGGAANMQNVVVNVLQADLPLQPAVDLLAIFRGNNFRVKSVDDSGVSWQILLVQEFA
jgi:hypothetical protein